MVYDANTRLSVERGSSPDSYGDDADVRHTIASEVRASIRSVQVRTSDPSDGRVYLVTAYRIRVPCDCDVREGDRLRTAAGGTYVVEQVNSDEPSWLTGFGKRVEARGT